MVPGFFWAPQALDDVNSFYRHSTCDNLDVQNGVMNAEESEGGFDE